MKILKLFVLLVGFSFLNSNSTQAQTIEELDNKVFDYYNQGDYSNAILYGEKGLKLAEKKYGKKDVNYATSLNNLAFLYKSIGNYVKSESLYIQALEVNKKALGETHPDYATCLNNLGTLYFSIGEYNKAEPLLVQALEIRKKTLGENNPDYALSLNHLALLYHNMGKYAQAEPLYLQSIEIRKEILGENNPDYAESLNNLAGLYVNMGNYIKAEPLYIQGMEITKKTLGEAHPAYATALNNLAALYDDIGDYPKAEPLYVLALEIRRNTLGETHLDYATSLNNLAFFYTSMGSYSKAEPLYLKSMEIRKRNLGEDHPIYATSLSNLAELYRDMGEYDKAEKLIVQAMEITKKALGEAHPSYALSLNNLAALYVTMGGYTQAAPLFVRAIAIRKKALGETHPDYAQSLNNLAYLYDNMGDYVKAKPLYEQAMEIRKKIFGEDHPDYAYSLNNLGLLYNEMGDYDKAKKLIVQAIEIMRKALGEAHPAYATSLNNLALIYDNMGNYLKAEPLYEQVMGIREKALGELHPDYAASLYNLAILYYNMRDYAKAEPLSIKLLETSFNNIKQQFSFLSEKEKENYFKTLEIRFDYFSVFSLKRKNNNPSITSQVYDNLLKTKGLLLKSCTSMRNSVLSSKDEKLIANFDKWNSLKKQIANIYNLPIEKRNQDLTKLEDEANVLEKELTRSSSVLSDFNSSLNISWKDIQTQLKPNEVAIEFTNFKYNKDSVLYCALIIKKDSGFPQMVQLFEEKELTSLLASLKEHNNYAITSVYGSKRFTETKLYDVIWKPLESYLKGIETINYSPSGLLHKVSFAALSNADDHYLIDDYKLNMLTSTALITKPTQSVFDKNTEVSLFGGINYSIKDTTNVPWNYLEGTLSETDQLNTTLKKQGIKVNYIKAKTATKQEFKTLAVNSNIIHIATHGFFFSKPQPIKTEEDEKKENRDIASRSASRAVELNYIRSDNPLMRSGLVFAGVNDYWNGITDNADSTGILTALDVVNIDLRKNKLVVLSACETGLGDIRGGEGVYGLQRAFKMAGTENIIMSLWQVPDKETSEFMQTFYNLLFLKQNINQAFEETQNLMRKKYDPYYWAAFVLMR